MTKVEESVKRGKDLKAQVDEFLDATDCLDDAAIKKMEEIFIEDAKKKGDEKVEEALVLANKAMSLIKNDGFKGILISCMLSKVPILIQNTILDGQRRVITFALSKSLMLLEAVSQSMEKKEENE